jgi:hypothetical protein
MNKKEVAEVKKQFKLNNNICSLEKILTSYVDHEKNIKFVEKRSFLNLPEIEVLLFMEMFKKTLSGGVGKNLLEFSFPIVDGGDGEDKTFLIGLKDSKLNDDEMNEQFVKKIVDNFEYAGDYYIASLYCSYSIPVKGKNTDEDGEDSLEVYNFIITSICPVSRLERGLCYDAEKNTIEKSYVSQLEATKPIHGFLFPAFNDRQMDVHNVLYYTSSPKEPSQSIIQNVLGCNIKLAADVQKEKFNNMLARVLGDDNTYNITSNIHSEIKQIIDNNVMESDPVELNSQEIKNILERCGVDEMNLEEFDDIYSEEVGDDVSLAAVNITNESAMKVDSPDIKISVKPSASEKVSAKLVDGKRCLVIALDETVELNGLDVSIR